MNNKLLKTMVLVVFVVAVGSILNLTLSLQGGTGTCCPEALSKCIIGEHVIDNHFYKQSGRCNPI